MTYPEATVATIVSRHVVPLKLNNQDEANQDVMERYHHVWTPDLRILEANGDELYRWNGYLAPFEYAPQLLAGLAQARLRLHDFDGAAELYHDAIVRFPTSMVAPEAEYFLAVSRYRKSHESSDLLKGWHRLASKFPGSTWTAKQDF